MILPQRCKVSFYRQGCVKWHTHFTIEFTLITFGFWSQTRTIHVWRSSYTSNQFLSCSRMSKNFINVEADRLCHFTHNNINAKKWRLPLIKKYYKVDSYMNLFLKGHVIALTEYNWQHQYYHAKIKLISWAKNNL